MWGGEVGNVIYREMVDLVVQEVAMVGTPVHTHMQVSP